jgi:signal transduction histidine kinase
MSPTDDVAAILLVDDNQNNLLTLEAALADLGQHLVRARSGREALRLLMQQDFAVILLDVDMPGMDGFETATLIRARKRFAQTPILFVTSSADEVHIARGYALGAVDYVLTPFTPEVLRTKVGVFVDLFHKTQQVRRQAASLQERTVQLHKLAAGLVAVNAAESADTLLEVVALQAREVLCAEVAMVTAALPGEAKPWRVVSVAPVVKGLRPVIEPPPLLADLTRSLRRPARLSRSELHLGNEGDAARLQSWLGAPMLGRDQAWLGVVEVANRFAGDFTEEDEMMLGQLTQVAALVLESTLYARERELNRAKDEFLATVSHELRTPLSAILGWSQLLREGELDENRHAHGIEVIERNARAQTKLVDDLLDASRMTAGTLRLQRRKVLLRVLVDSVVDGFRPQAAEKALALEVVHDLPAEAAVFGDADRLAQVMRNLLSNAVKFTPPQGRVKVTSEGDATTLRVVVSDTGCGISARFLPHVFDRFRQADSSTSRRHGGLGIGLTIARHIVELHGGAIDASSPGPGLGSTFVVELPVLQAGRAVIEASAPGEPALPDDEGNLDGVRAMVVEDEDDSRMILTSLLERHGAVVLAVPTAASALEQVSEFAPTVLVTDIGLPEQDGYALLRQVRLAEREELRTLPAIALTAFVTDADRARALAAGFHEHLRKPVDATELVATVSACTRRDGGDTGRLRTGRAS